MEREDVYNVEKIVDSRVLGGKKQYYIKWEGYPDDFNTWEYEKDIFCKDLIVEYETASAKLKPKAKARKKTTKGTPARSSRAKSRESTPAKGEEGATGSLPESDSWEGMIDEIITVQWNTASKRLDVQFRMKNGNVGVVPASDAHFHFPRALIKFYEKHISFQSDSDDKDLSELEKK